jgi:hypothetical protein
MRFMFIRHFLIALTGKIHAGSGEKHKKTAAGNDISENRKNAPSQDATVSCNNW